MKGSITKNYIVLDTEFYLTSHCMYSMMMLEMDENEIIDLDKPSFVIVHLN